MGSDESNSLLPIL